MCSAGGKIMILESPESSFESVIMKSESLSEENYENILSIKQNTENLVKIEKEVKQVEFIFHHAVPDSLRNIDFVMEFIDKVPVLKGWYNNALDRKISVVAVRDSLTNDAEGVTYNKGKSISLSKSAFNSYAKLALVIGHELQHCFHHISGQYAEWEKIEKNQKKEDYAKIRTEYEAWFWSWTYVDKGKKYGVYDRYLKYKDKYKQLGGKVYE